MSGLSKLGISLTIVFIVSLLALSIELFYILWRRRLFKRHSTAVHGEENHHHLNFSSENSSKDLLYFFCIKTQVRVEPDGAPTQNSNGSSPDESTVEEEEEVIDVLKLQQSTYGPPRFLFPIKEEEREDMESEKSLCLSEKTKIECFGVDGELPEVEVVVVVDIDNETMPFSTPCGSPLYLTPLSSPARDVDVGQE